MSLEFRATTPGDRPALAAFLQSVFAIRGDAPVLNPQMMAWKYWDARGDWDEPRSWILEKNGAVAAHAGIWPMTFGSGAEAIRGIQMIDWASSKESAGAGLALVRRFAGMFDFIYSIGGSEATQKILPKFGFVECMRTWQGARPLRPLRQILSHQRRGWKLAPRLLRNTVWAHWPPAVVEKEWAAEVISPQGIPADEMGTQTAGRYSPRSGAFFEYLSRCPGADCRLWAISRSGKRVGVFLLAMVRRQARIGGIWLRQPDRESERQAYALAVTAARGMRNAAEVIVSGSAPGSAEEAARAGLRVFGGAPVFLLNAKGKLKLPGDFQFQLADDDSAFLDTGSCEYVT